MKRRTLPPIVPQQHGPTILESLGSTRGSLHTQSSAEARIFTRTRRVSARTLRLRGGLGQRMEILDDQGNWLSFKQALKKLKAGTLRVACYNQESDAISHVVVEAILESTDYVLDIHRGIASTELSLNNPIVGLDGGGNKTRFFDRNRVQTTINGLRERSHNTFNRKFGDSYRYRFPTYVPNGLQIVDSLTSLRAAAPELLDAMPDLCPDWGLLPVDALQLPKGARRGRGRKAVGKCPDKKTAILKFLWLLGFWLGDGSLECNKENEDAPVRTYVLFANNKPSDVKFIRQHLNILGLVRGVDYSESKHKNNTSHHDTTVFRIWNEGWVRFFAENWGFKYQHIGNLAHNTRLANYDGNLYKISYENCKEHHPEEFEEESDDEPRMKLFGVVCKVSSAKWLLYWMFKLPERYADAILRGLSEADGRSSSSKDVASGRLRNTTNCVFTSSEKFRDQVVSLAIHAGRTAHYSLNCEKGKTIIIWHKEKPTAPKKPKTSNKKATTSNKKPKNTKKKAPTASKKKTNGLKFSVATAQHDCWTVHYSVPAGRARNSCIFERRDIVSKPTSAATWGVVLPDGCSGLIIARRASPDREKSFLPVLVAGSFLSSEKITVEKVAFAKKASAPNKRAGKKRG